MQQAVDRQAHRLGMAATLRVGIADGDVEEARRLCEAAAPGSIAASRAVAGRTVSPPRAAGADPTGIDAVPWEPARAVAVPLAEALAVEADAAFAGRTVALATLHAAWDAATHARRRGVLITGEPGIGKTRLAAELARRAEGDGGLVLYGHCDDGLAAPAQPFADALGAYVAACPVDELRVQLGTLGSAALPVLPGLAGRLPGPAELEPPEPDTARLRTLDAIAGLLAAAGAVRPILLVLDDLHWADDLSLLLLRQVLRADVRTRLLVVATYRDTEPSRSPLLNEIVTGLARRPEVERLELGPLAEPDIATILTHSGRDRSLAARVRVSTEGNPFFVGEVVRALGSSRLRRPRHHPARARRRAVAACAPRERRRGRARDRRGGGPRVRRRRDSRRERRRAHRTLDALETAEHARLVRPVERSDRFTFVHALVRQTILDDLPGARRTRLHTRIADALERARATRAVDAGELASHLLAAGSLADPSQGAGLRARGGRQRRAAARVRRRRRSLRASADRTRAAARSVSRAAARPGAGPRPGAAARRRRAGGRRPAAGGRASRARGRRRSYGRGPADHRARARDALLEEDTEMVALLRRAVELLPDGDSAVKARLLGYHTVFPQVKK